MLRLPARRVSRASMRTLVVTLLVILGVVFGGTHASAFQHIDEDASAIVQSDDHSHSHSHADADNDDDGRHGSDQEGSEVGTHNHCAMDRTVASVGIACPMPDRTGAIRPPMARSLSSLDQAPPLEPPSA